jgi:MFS family permease
LVIKKDDTGVKTIENMEIEDFKGSEKKKKGLCTGLVFSILFITGMANSAYAIIAPFLPFEFKRKGIDKAWIGGIFSVYSVAVIFCSPMVGLWIPTVGRRPLIQGGMMMMGVSFLVFGFAGRFEDKNTFIIIQFVNRFI